MHDYVKTLGTVIRKAREEQGMSQASLAEKLGIDVRTIINIENFRGNPKFEVLYPLVTTLRIPADRIFTLKPSPWATVNSSCSGAHSLSEKEALELLPVIRCLAEMMRKHGSENP